MATPHARIGISRAQVDRAGILLRDWYESGLLADEGVERASVILNAYRSEFKGPLRSVVMGLRSAVRTSGRPVVVAERLKRQPRIIGKLQRFHEMQLTRMQDIAGCRAILPDLATVQAFYRRLERQKSEVVKVFDYIAQPKMVDTGPFTSSSVVMARWSKSNSGRPGSSGGRCWSRIWTAHTGSG